MDNNAHPAKQMHQSSRACPKSGQSQIYGFMNRGRTKNATTTRARTATRTMPPTGEPRLGGSPRRTGDVPASALARGRRPITSAGGANVSGRGDGAGRCAALGARSGSGVRRTFTGLSIKMSWIDDATRDGVCGEAAWRARLPGADRRMFAITGAFSRRHGECFAACSFGLLGPGASPGGRRGLRVIIGYAGRLRFAIVAREDFPAMAGIPGGFGAGKAVKADFR
jgi:hypothetical protein